MNYFILFCICTSHDLSILLISRFILLTFLILLSEAFNGKSLWGCGIGKMGGLIMICLSFSSLPVSIRCVGLRFIPLLFGFGASLNILLYTIFTLL